MDQSTITVVRTPTGELRAETEIAMKEEGRILNVCTARDYRGLTTRALSIRLEARIGFVVRHYEIHGDYARIVERTNKRGTKNAVHEQHARALERIEQLLAEAEAFYAAKEAIAQNI